MVKKVSLNGGSGGDFKSKPLTEGVQEARIARVLDIGEQPPPKNNIYGKGPQRQLLIMFELSDDKVMIGEEEKPAFVSLFMNLVGGERAKLTKLAKAIGIESDELDLGDLIGRPLSVTIVNKTGSDGNVRSYVNDFSGLSKRVADAVPELQDKGYFFDFDNPDEEVAKSFGDGMKRIFSKALNFSGSQLEVLFNQPVVKEEAATNDIV